MTTTQENTAPDPYERVEGDPCPTCGERIALTCRQHSVLLLTAVGHDIRSIGHSLGCGHPVVARELARMRKLTGARTNGQLVLTGARAGLVPPLVPDRPPGSPTAPQLRLFVLLGEGQAVADAADAAGIRLEAARRLQYAVYQRLGVRRLAAALAMLHAIGALEHHHPCPNPACEQARRTREQPEHERQAARDAALRWADQVTQAAALRGDLRRGRAELARIVAELTAGQAELEACRTAARQAREALRQTETDAGTVGGELREIRRELAAAADDVARTRDDARLLQHGQNGLEQGFEELEAARDRLVTGWVQLAAANEQATRAQPAPARAPIPPQDRAWHRPPTTHR
ncbi:hypothetical protein ACFXPX_36650 [Kitasatospora sp. NPDC059146]|uniref:hypothetical protein n=1 Tax=unclassified Kitasatospora TaxID=2633591 RepID=UPI0036B8897B